MNNQFPFYLGEDQLTFYSAGQWWDVLKEHKRFKEIITILKEDRGGDGTDLINMISDQEFLNEISGGRLKMDKGKVLLDGEPLSQVWQTAIRNNPDVARVLFLKEGDIVQIEGDEDAPDGEYAISSIDTNDIEKSIYLETDDGFFGFISNKSIKGSRHA